MIYMNWKYTKIMRADIEVVVISVYGSESLPKIQNVLSEIGYKTRVLVATTPESSDFILSDSATLSTVEIATSISHQRARKFALDLGCEWVIILEDDAQIADGFDDIETLIGEIERDNGRNSKLAVHLYPEQFGILKINSNKPYLRVLSVPDCAVGYAMNRHAMRATMSIKGIDQEVADWHPEIRKFSWFAPKFSLVTHPDVKDSKVRSLTSNPRQNRLRQSSFIEKLIKYPYLKMFLIRFPFPYASPYGSNPISSEKLRTKAFSWHRNESKNG